MIDRKDQSKDHTHTRPKSVDENELHGCIEHSTAVFEQQTLQLTSTVANVPGLRSTSSLQYPGACWMLPASAAWIASTAAFLCRLTVRDFDWRPTFFLYKRPSSAPFMLGLLAMASAAKGARVAAVALATPPEQLACCRSTYEILHSLDFRPIVARTSDWHPPPSLARPEQMNFF